MGRTDETDENPPPRLDEPVGSAGVEPPADEDPEGAADEDHAADDEPARSRWTRRRIAKIAVACVLLPPLLLAAGIAVAYWRIKLPPDHVMAQSTLVCAADVTSGCDDGNAMAAFVGDQDRTNVKLAEVAPVMIDAVLSAEDRSFYSHSGVDPAGTFRALLADVRGRATQGGSTITQQYVKNVYLASDAGARSGISGLTRKVKEAVLAVKVEHELSKDEILERYLNTIYFGRGAYGIGAAARTYFGRSAHDLDVAQAAFLAGLIRSPGTADPAVDPAQATRRRRTVLDAMVDAGKLSAADRDAADARPWTVATLPDGSDGTVLPRASRSYLEVRKGGGTGTEYFLDEVRRQLNAKGFSDAEIYSGGLRVYTTLDLTAQQHAWESVTGTLDQPDDPAAALVSIDRGGNVRAMIGGRDHEHNQVNLALGADGGGSGRQAGSSFKPFVLTTAIRQGISLDERFSAPSRIVLPKADAGHDWVVNNAEPSSGSLDLTSATALSSNTVYAQLMLKVGPDKVAATAKDLGISSPLPTLPSLALGTADVSPMEMANAYSTIARGGERVTPRVVTKVVRADGTEVSFDQEHAHPIAENDANLVTSALRQVIERGTGTGANPGVPAAGKTGTTENHHDAWFVGYLPDGLTTAVWMGYQNAPGQPAQTMEHVRGGPVFGGGLPATIWRQFMAAAAQGRDVGQFTEPTAPTPGDFAGAPVPGDGGGGPANLPASSPADASSSSSEAVAGPPTTSGKGGGPPATSPTTSPPSTSPPTTSPPTTSPPTTSPPTTVAAAAGNP